MTEYLRVYNDSAILKGVLEFPATAVWTETPIFTYILNVHGCKNDQRWPNDVRLVCAVIYPPFYTACLYNIGNV